MSTTAIDLRCIDSSVGAWEAIVERTDVRSQPACGSESPSDKSDDHLRLVELREEA